MYQADIVLQRVFSMTKMMELEIDERNLFQGVTKEWNYDSSAGVASSYRLDAPILEFRKG